MAASQKAGPAVRCESKSRPPSRRLMVLVSASVMGLGSSSPSERYLVARIMLLSVVSTKTATLCHQIQSRQVNLGSVVCRSIHSTTHDLAKPSSQRRDFSRSGVFSARSDHMSVLKPPSCPCSSGTRSHPSTCDGARRLICVREQLSRASCPGVAPRQEPSASGSRSGSHASA